MARSSRFQIAGSFASTVFAVVAFTISAQGAFAQESLTAKDLEGVWKVTKVVQGGVLNSNPQPSLYMFSRGYYTALRVNGNEARKQAPAPKDRAHVTDAEKIALYDEWAPYAASGGTYEVKGNTLINHNVVAKMVGGMTITEQAVITDFDGNSFVATPTAGSNSDRHSTYTRIK